MKKEFNFYTISHSSNQNGVQKWCTENESEFDNIEDAREYLKNCIISEEENSGTSYLLDENGNCINYRNWNETDIK